MAATTKPKAERCRSGSTIRSHCREAGFWTGIGAPKGTTAAIIDRLNKKISTGLAVRQGGEVRGN
jgi:hypothetical protein